MMPWFGLIFSPVMLHRLPSAWRQRFCVFRFGTMHTGWVKNKTHETSTFKRMINSVVDVIKFGSLMLWFPNRVRYWKHWLDRDLTSKLTELNGWPVMWPVKNITPGDTEMNLFSGRYKNFMNFKVITGYINSCFTHRMHVVSIFWKQFSSKSPHKSL